MRSTMGIKKSKRGEIVLDRHACQAPTGGACASFEDWSVEEQEWLDILLALEERGHPDKVVLARHLRSPKFVVEQPVLDYLADHLEGKTRKRLGRPRTETIEQ